MSETTSNSVLRPGGVWLIVGAQGAGKSTIADLLARQFAAGVHIRGGQFYRWAVTGWQHTGPRAGDDARRHLELRYRLAAMTADEYASEGFTAVVQDNLYGQDVVAWLDQLRSRPRHLVVLRPSVEVVRLRDQHRMHTTGKVAYRPGSHTAADLDRFLGETPRVGLWLDTTEQTAEETAAEIAARQVDAIVA